jgi:hypothetical protein
MLPRSSYAQSPPKNSSYPAAARFQTPHLYRSSIASQLRASYDGFSAAQLGYSVGP